MHEIDVEHKLSRRHTQGPQQLKLVFRGQDKAILEHTFDGVPYGFAIIVEQHIPVACSGMVEVRSNAPKDGNPAACDNVPEPPLIQQTSRFNKQRGRGLIECLEFVGHSHLHTLSGY